MSNFIEYCKNELEAIEAFNKDKDFYGGMTGESVMELCEVFDKQGHSGMSASLVRNLFNKLAQYLPLSSIKDEGWNEVGLNSLQNKRLSSLFKDKETGEVHYNEAVVFREENGSTFTGHVGYKGIKCSSFWIIKSFPFTPKTFYIDVISYRFKDKEGLIPDENGSWWEHDLKDPEQLKEVYEYYDKPVIKGETK